MSIPATLSTLIDDLTVQLPLILGRNLVGIYLYGSVTNSSFNPKRSDVDCLVVTRRELSDAQFRKLKSWFQQTAKSNPWTIGLQITFLIRDKVLTMNAPACSYQFGDLKRGSSDGNPIIWLDHLRSGKILFGPPAESFLPEITSEVFVETLKRELEYLREEIIEKSESEWRDVPMYRAYAVLTVCRILYSFEKGIVTSKPIAAKWAMKNLPNQWNGIIQQALDFDNDKVSSEIPLKRIEKFLRFGLTHFSDTNTTLPFVIAP